MTTIDVKNVNGEVCGSADLNPAVFEIEPNVPVMHRTVKAQRASWRAGTHATRTRGMVRGGGRKPWRQKGTGRARQGTIRAPQWTGGGVVFGPHPHGYHQKVNRKEVKLAMRSALSAKLADGELVIINEFPFEAPKTKDAVKALKALGLDDRRITLVIGDEDIETYLSFRNLQNVTIIPVSDINTYDIIDNKALVITEPSLEYIEEVLA
ncbi:MAG: 50S ribosomal protein L4 [Eggerthellaceae bacterium]|nr:50S ribosomal protein L4 [Eggerthellaceae bacterium]